MERWPTEFPERTGNLLWVSVQKHAYYEKLISMFYLRKRYYLSGLVFWYCWQMSPVNISSENDGYKWEETNHSACTFKTCVNYWHMSRLSTKPTKWVCAERRLRSAGHPPSLIRVFACAQWVAKDPSFLHTDSEDSDQTGRMPRLIWVFAGRILILLVLSWGGSYLHCD